MSLSILHRANSTAGVIPAASALKLREIGVNTADGILYVQKTDGTIKAINPFLGQAPLSVTLDMGQTPVQAQSFQVSVTGVQVGQNVFASVSGVMQNGALPDELEMEPMAVFGAVTAVNTIYFTLTCLDMLLVTVGKKTVNFYVG